MMPVPLFEPMTSLNGRVAIGRQDLTAGREDACAVDRQVRGILHVDACRVATNRNGHSRERNGAVKSVDTNRAQGTRRNRRNSAACHGYGGSRLRRGAENRNTP